MAEPKTKKVFVRLVRGFPEGVTHRRGGVELTAGPTPVEAEVTAEQLDALKGDHSIEIVSEKEAKRWEKYQSAAPHHPSAGELAGDEAGESSGRDYSDGNDTGSDDGDGSDDGSNGSDEDEGDGEGGDELPELTGDLKLKELKQIAADEGVADVEQFNKPGTSKQTVIDAIEAHRAANANSGE